MALLFMESKVLHYFCITFSHMAEARFPPGIAGVFTEKLFLEGFT